MDLDHTAFTSDDFLGVEAVYTPEGLPERTVRVAFTKESTQLSLGGQTPPVDYDAQAGCAYSLVLEVKKGDTLDISGVRYVVSRFIVDETGWATIFLAKDLR